ncbi:MAG: MFS transporter [Burkholderiales bacterium]|nr:MAG: MFS transporter [Burkholderiales bacterium]
MVIVGVGMACALHIGKLPAAIPALQAGLGLTLVQAGFLLSLVQLAGMTLGLGVGLVADRLGPRRVMLAGLCLLAAGSALGALSTGVSVLLATRALEGLGFLLAVLPAPGLLRQCVQHPPTLARALGWWGAYMPVGMAVALLAGAPLIGWVGWRGLWLVLALLSVAAAVVLARAVPAAPGHAVASGAAMTGVMARVRRTLSAPAPMLMALAFFCYSGQWLAVVGFLPTIYTEAGVGGALAGLLGALVAGINMTGNIASGRLLARGARPGILMAAGYGVMGAGALVTFVATGHPWLQFAAVLLFSSMGGLIPGTLFGLAVVLAPGRDTVSTTVGWMQQWSAFGQFVGPPLVAWLATRVGGWHWTWTLTGLASLCGLWVAWRLQSAWAASR